MDNSKQAFPLPGQSGMPNMAANPGAMPMGGNQMQNGYGMPNMQPGINQMQMQNDGTAVVEDNKMDLIKNIALIALGVIALILGILFVLKLKDYNELSADIDGKIAMSTAEAVDENSAKLEKEFAEREKSPLRSFTGPEDYGALSFDYPKTWGIYVDSDASKGGDYVAYFNPVQIDPLSDKASVYALRLTITNTSFEKTVAKYQNLLSQKKTNLSMNTITVNGTVANHYSGTIPGTDFNGYIVIIKIRDKSAILQTESYLFEADYNKLLDSIQFNS
ncbi:hypothetical protein J6T21_03950 [Candidatus Saccharibacteria bacterium]|nr:hypothetical protein [Candidatus Saccharibacteria bacterium]